MRRDPASETLIQANAENVYQIGTADLPPACPMRGTHLWNSHPRVYLAVEATGKAKCPYCGAVYVLAQETAATEEAAHSAAQPA